MTLVINLILTICLCDKYSLHNSILYIINNVIALPINAPVGKHQRESVSGHCRFSKTHVFRVKIFDSSHGFSANQKDVKIQLLTQAPPTFDNGIGRLSHPVPQKYVCRGLIIAFFL